MKKAFFAVVVMTLLGACLPMTPTLNSNPSPNLDLAGTAVIQTLTAQPTSTFIPSTETTIPTNTTTSEVMSSATLTSSATPVATITSGTPTFEIVTSTSVAGTLPAGLLTETATPGVLTYGTLPPAVPFSNVTLINRAKRQVYISLQVVTTEGGPTILEYPVTGQIKIKAPTGHYTYVAWVGGRQMVGEFRLHKGDDLFIILYKDKVVIK